MTIDFDCKVGSSRCTNNWRTQDDSWKGRLAAGSHRVEVYPYETGPGNYSLTVTGTETVTYVATPMTAIGRICTTPAGGEETCTTLYKDQTTNAPTGPRQPIQTRPGQSDPAPTPPPDSSPNPRPTTTTSDVIGSLKNMVEATKLDCRGMNFEVNERLGTTHGGTNTTRTGHSGIDMNTKGSAASSTPR